MRFAAILWAVVSFSAAAQIQTFTLGTPNDPCSGGQPLTVFNSTATVRWGDFRCTFPVSLSAKPNAAQTDGEYVLELDFIEPCALPAACAGGQVTKTGQRVLNAFANDQPILTGLDVWGAIFQGVTPAPAPDSAAKRYTTVWSANGQITVRIQTVLRSGVLARVVITPMGFFNPVAQMDLRFKSLDPHPELAGNCEMHIFTDLARRFEHPDTIAHPECCRPGNTCTGTTVHYVIGYMVPLQTDRTYAYLIRNGTDLSCTPIGPCGRVMVGAFRTTPGCTGCDAPR